jgi:hypothetical protein
VERHGRRGRRLGLKRSAGHPRRQARRRDAQRRGGFSDVDRETVTTYDADVKRVRIASHHNLKNMLVDAWVDEATAEADVEALRNRCVLVLAHSAMGLDQIATVIDC